MSAYLCDPLHIATCADIIYSKVYRFHSGYRKMERPDIAQGLARENWRSVSFRYSPMGKEAYAALLGQIERQLRDAGHREVLRGADLNNDLPGPAHVESYSDYLLKSRMAKPLTWEKHPAGDWLKWLACLDYQSCEHDEWEKSDARMWLLEAESAIADELATAHAPSQLKGWTIDPEPAGEEEEEEVPGAMLLTQIMNMENTA